MSKLLEKSLLIIYFHLILDHPPHLIEQVRHQLPLIELKKVYIFKKFFLFH